MKNAKYGTLLVTAFLAAGCVTESTGVLIPEPASNAEQAEVNLALGVSYIQQQRPDLAIDPLRRAIEVDPRSADAHSVLALAYDQQGSTELAEEHHRRASQLAPRNAVIQNSYAVFLCIRNRWADAEPSFQRAIDATTREESVETILNAARCARGAADLVAAERYFREALTIAPRNVEALRGMVDMSIRSSNFLAGRGFWQRLEQANPVSPEDLLACVVIEQQLNASDAADACATRLQREYPSSPAVNQLRDIVRDGI